MRHVPRPGVGAEPAALTRLVAAAVDGHAEEVAQEQRADTAVRHDDQVAVGRGHGPLDRGQDATLRVDRALPPADG